MGRGHVPTHTNGQTSRLLERIGLRADSLKIDWWVGVVLFAVCLNPWKEVYEIMKFQTETKKNVSGKGQVGLSL